MQQKHSKCYGLMLLNVQEHETQKNINFTVWDSIPLFSISFVLGYGFTFTCPYIQFPCIQGQFIAL